jgi:hypothetical protein
MYKELESGENVIRRIAMHFSSHKRCFIERFLEKRRDMVSFMPLLSHELKFARVQSGSNIISFTEKARCIGGCPHAVVVAIRR